MNDSLRGVIPTTAVGRNSIRNTIQSIYATIASILSEHLHLQVVLFQRQVYTYCVQ